jgi:hypothetical protein
MTKTFNLTEKLQIWYKKYTSVFTSWYRVVLTKEEDFFMSGLGFVVIMIFYVGG